MTMIAMIIAFTYLILVIGAIHHLYAIRLKCASILLTVAFPQIFKILIGIKKTRLGEFYITNSLISILAYSHLVNCMIISDRFI